MVGITTRCSEYNIQWLKDFLKEKFQDLILDVEHFLITNTNRYEWEKNVNKYSAVILYHTQRQGRVNITNVEGEVYNEELNFLCHKLGGNWLSFLLTNANFIIYLLFILTQDKDHAEGEVVESFLPYILCRDLLLLISAP